MRDDDKRLRPFATKISVAPWSMSPESSDPSAPLEEIQKQDEEETYPDTLYDKIADAVWEKQEEERLRKDDREAGERLRRGPIPESASLNEHGWYVPPRPPAPPKRLSAAVPSSGGPTWIASAPDIEQAIYTLLCKLKRSPTDDEIAEKLHLTVDRYHEALILLSDIENEIGLGSVRPSDDATGNVLFLSTGRGDAVFCCLRSEMMTLFKAAISSLPERELLIIQLRYVEEFTGVQISVTLNIDESTLTRLGASALLHLEARIYGSLETDHYISGDSVQPFDYRGRRKDLTGPKANIYMSASQSGWLPTGFTWESLGSAVNFTRFMQTYFFINDSGELERVEHSERIGLEVKKYRGNQGDKGENEL